MPKHRGFEYELAGWGKNREWGKDMRSPETFSPSQALQATAKITDTSIPVGQPGRVTFMTIHGPFASQDQFDEFVEITMDAPEYSEVY